MAEAASNCLLCPNPLDSNDGCTNSLTSSHVSSLCKILKISNANVLQDSLSSTKICSTCAATLSDAEEVIVKLEELELKLTEIGKLIKDSLQKNYLTIKNSAKTNDASCSQTELQVLLCKAARVHEPEDYIEIVPLEFEDQQQYEDEFNAFNDADAESRLGDDGDSEDLKRRAHHDQQESDSGNSCDPCWSPGNQESENEDNQSSASDDSIRVHTTCIRRVYSNKKINTSEPSSSKRQLRSHTAPEQSQMSSSRSTLNILPRIQNEILKCVYSSCKEEIKRTQKLSHVTQPHEDIQAVEGTAFKCKKCNTSYVKYEDLINHAKTDHINEKCSLKKFIICQFCGGQYCSIRDLGLHVKRHEGNLSCDICDQTFMYKRHLRKHMRTHKTEHPEISQDEDSQSNEAVPTSNAAGSGGSGDLYLCSTCGMTFSCVVERKRHRDRHYQERKTPRRSLSCRACNKTFSDEKQLDEHISSSSVCSLMIEKGQAKWACRKCGVGFDEVGTRNDHQRDCTEMIKRVCPYRECGQQFINEQVLMSHLKEPHDLGDHAALLKEFRCRDCDRICSSHAELRSHLESEHSLEVLESHRISLCCQYCGNVESDVNSLRNHVESHQLPYPCVKCSLKFPDPSALKEHEKKYDRRKKPRVSEPETTTETCLDCSESFPNKKLLLEHVEVCSAKKSADEPYYCEQCGKDFPNQKKLVLHIYNHHDPSRKNDVFCEVCHRTFPNHSQLIRHRRSHFPDEKLKCPLCPASYNRKSRLVLHIKMKHYGTGALKCSQCDYTCADKGQMEAHGRKHTGERPFMCDICGMNFTSAPILKTHSRYHQDRPYKCEICGHAFVFKHRYERHVRTHIMPKKPHYKILRRLQKENALREQGESVDVECDGSELN